MTACCCPVAKWLIRGLALAAAMLAFLAVPGRSQENAPGGALAKVPPDALGFVHIKTNELWKAEMFGGLREMLLKAGPPALQAFNKRFSPPLGNVESICVYVTPQNEDVPPTPGLIVAFSEKFDP